MVLKLIIAFTLVSILLSSGCSDSPTDSGGQPPPDQSSLLLSKLSVSVVPGGSEEIRVCAVGSDGSPDSCVVSSSNTYVATASITDSTITITGANLGTAAVTVVSNCGLSCTIPVEVYNSSVLDVGELTVTYVDSFNYIWHDEGSHAPNNCAFYHPVVPDGYHALGSLGVPNWSSPNGKYAMMVVKEEDGSDALTEPTDYELIWEYKMRMIPYLVIASFWKPIPPNGYVAIGMVVTKLDSVPPSDYIACVREDLTIEGEAGAYIWHDEDTGMPRNLGCWRVDQPDCGPHDYCYLTAGTFVGWNNWSPPTYHDLLHILKVELPTLAEGDYQSYLPQLTSFEEPPLESPPMMAKAMLVPCTIVNDLQYSGNLRWRIANSPFYRLERRVFYKRLYHNHNTSSQPQTNMVRIISGVTTTESQRFWEETSVEISVEAGISVGVFEGKVSTTVTETFGYETQTSVAELEQKEIETSVNTAPGYAAACWQKYNKYYLRRHNGTSFETVYSWEFGIDSYVVDDYCEGE